MVIMLSDKQTVQIRTLTDGTREIRFLQTNKIYVVQGEVTISMLERLK